MLARTDWNKGRSACNRPGRCACILHDRSYSTRFARARFKAKGGKLAQSIPSDHECGMRDIALVWIRTG